MQTIKINKKYDSKSINMLGFLYITRYYIHISLDNIDKLIDNPIYKKTLSPDIITFLSDPHIQALTKSNLQTIVHLVFNLIYFAPVFDELYRTNNIPAIDVTTTNHFQIKVSLADLRNSVAHNLNPHFFSLMDFEKAFLFESKISEDGNKKNLKKRQYKIAIIDLIHHLVNLDIQLDKIFQLNNKGELFK